MKVAILETGRPPGTLAEEFGDYPTMFARMLGSEFEVESFDVAAGELPDATANGAYLITGSPARVYEQLPWMDRVAQIAAPASHQDQVVRQPPNSIVTLQSSFTPFAGLAWTDRPAISFQFHPEFEPDFAKALIERRYDIVPDADAAIASLDAPNDNARVAAWIGRFLKS